MRPTPQMVREALFSILGNAVPGRVFYDVFAGTGVVGLEAVSRGATSARLIEKDPRQAADIQKYADQFGVGTKVQVLRADVYRWAERWIPPGPEPVNLFLSPPFPDLTERAGEFLGLVKTLLEKAPDESVLTIQAEDGFPVGELPDLPAWDVRRYGRNMLLFYVISRPAPAPADGQSTPTAGPSA
jgi:16S rRNA (guanine966-N2)-methyltransferase